jgi:putative FmdB family regulatory protein
MVPLANSLKKLIVFVMLGRGVKNMPIFEYTCEKCDYRFDRLMIRSDSEVKCPICQNRVKKLYSSFSVGHSQVSAFNPQASFEPKLCKNC